MNVAKDLLRKISWKSKYLIFENPIMRVMRFQVKWSKYAFSSGLFSSVYRNYPQDQAGNPLPWISLACIGFLDKLELDDYSVCELGSGASTHFWSKRCFKVATFEHSQEWLDKIISGNSTSNVTGTYLEEDFNFSNFNFSGYDIIMIDGLDRTSAVLRLHKQVMENQVSPKLIIFDNADWYPKSVALLSEVVNYIPIDFEGFPPMGMAGTLTRVYLRIDGDLSWLRSVRAVSAQDKDKNPESLYSLE